MVRLVGNSLYHNTARGHVAMWLNYRSCSVVVSLSVEGFHQRYGLSAIHCTTTLQAPMPRPRREATRTCTNTSQGEPASQMLGVRINTYTSCANTLHIHIRTRHSLLSIPRQLSLGLEWPRAPAPHPPANTMTSWPHTYGFVGTGNRLGCVCVCVCFCLSVCVCVCWFGLHLHKY